MKSGARLAVIVAVMFIAVLLFWWFGLAEYRETVFTVQHMKTEIAKMQAHVHETERVLAAVEALKNEVRDARSVVNEELSDSLRYSGAARIDRLERLLETDLARRAGDTASCGPAGGLQGAGGVRASPAAPESAAD